MRMSRSVEFTVSDTSGKEVRQVKVEVRFDFNRARPEAVYVDGELWTLSCAGNSERTDR
jgi:hypothetical protein